MDLRSRIKELTEKAFPAIVSIRHSIHQHPELAYNEYNTSALIAAKLSSLGIPFTQGHAGTGILAVIAGSGKTGKTVLIRADMDALQVIEKTGLHFQSVNYGIMHACGHDMHTACVLGAAEVISQLNDKFAGKILLLFQPAEEKIPGGAKLIIDEGVFSKNPPDYVLALHVDPELKTGTAGFKAGPYMASVDDIFIRIKGHGGHAALPHMVTDTITAACEIVLQLKKNIIHPHQPSVFAIGRIDAHGSTNIIPDEVTLSGTFRALDETWRYDAHRLIATIAQNAGKPYNVTVETEIQTGYPFLKNDPELTEHSIHLSGQYCGVENIFKINCQMTAEDFAYFSHLFPSLMFRLGITPDLTNQPFPLHSSHFTADDNAIKTGAGLLAFLAINLTDK